jgi:hypothetical protein
MQQNNQTHFHAFKVINLNFILAFVCLWNFAQMWQKVHIKDMVVFSHIYVLGICHKWQKKTFFDGRLLVNWNLGSFDRWLCLGCSPKLTLKAWIHFAIQIAVGSFCLQGDWYEHQQQQHRVFMLVRDWDVYGLNSAVLWHKPMWSMWQSGSDRLDHHISIITCIDKVVGTNQGYAAHSSIGSW